MTKAKEIVTAFEAMLTNLVKSWHDDETLRITSYATNAALNAEVLKYGQKCGFASGYVIDKNYTSLDNGVKGLTRCILGAGVTDHGDSGGPYFYINPDPYNVTFTFVGVHHGKSLSDNGDTYLIYTPYQLFSNFFIQKTY